MINIVPYVDRGIEVYDGIVSNKNKDARERLFELRDTVDKRYKEYNKYKIELSEVLEQQNFTEQNKIDLINCYGSNTCLDEIKMIIRELQVPSIRAICPYCGINEPNTFDHYMQKGKFPEFAVLPLNLVPCCEKCNNKKREVWVVNGRRTIINYYFDRIPEQKYLYAALNFIPESPSVPTINFIIERHSELDDNMYEIILSHYTKLELLKRFEAQANDEVSNLFEEIVSSSKEQTIDVQRKTLSLRVSSYKKRYGRNHWKVVLYEGIMQSDEFFNLCRNM